MPNSRYVMECGQGDNKMLQNATLKAKIPEFS